MARWISCLKQIVTTRLFGLGIAIIVLPLSAIKNQKPCKLSLKTEAKSVLKANKYSQITMQNSEFGSALGTSILEKATALTYGKAYFFELGGAGYTGNDLPRGSYSYGMALILARNRTSIRVILFGNIESDIPVYNTRDGGGWTGWNKFDGTPL